jgi:integrase
MSKYNFNFYLEFPQNEIKISLQKKTIITLVCRRKQHLIKYRTPIEIFPTQWDFSKREIKRNNVGYATLNDTLKRIVSNAELYFFECLNEGKLFEHYGLKDRLDIELGLKVPESKITFYEFIEQFIKDANITRQPTTIKSYKTTQAHLKGFGKKWNPIKNPDFEDITLKYYYEFVSYLGNEKKLALNTIGKDIKNLKLFLSEAFDRGLHHTDVYKNKKFKVLKVDPDAIYLTEQELELIRKRDFSENPKLEKVRDAFLVGCFTGLRFSDLERLTMANVVGDFQYLRITPKKTKGLSPDKITIPIFDQVREIFKKYLVLSNSILPPIISNQKTNEYLKDVGKQSGLTYFHKFEERVGSQTVCTEIEKYKLITSHTARRSFATNMYLLGNQPIDIMAVTGHRTESSFMRYIKMSNNQAADRLKSGMDNISKDFIAIKTEETILNPPK